VASILIGVIQTVSVAIDYSLGDASEAFGIVVLGHGTLNRSPEASSSRIAPDPALSRCWC
jgi:hypothetical protein